MPWVARNNKRLWLGRHLGLGAVIIAEREIRRGGDEMDVYVVSERKLSTFKTKVLRSRIQPNGMTDAEALNALAEFDGPVVENHSAYLGRIGKPAANLQEASSSYLRTTQCHRCTSPIDTDFNLECAACGWIVCNCGACGCRSSEVDF